MLGIRRQTKIRFIVSADKRQKTEVDTNVNREIKAITANEYFNQIYRSRIVFSTESEDSVY